MITVEALTDYAFARLERHTQMLLDTDAMLASAPTLGGFLCVMEGSPEHAAVVALQRDEAELAALLELIMRIR